jgi:ribosomal protein L11 methyltransferase
VWEQPGQLVAWFPTRDVDGLPAGGTFTDEPDRDWQAEWKATIAPVLAGRFAVVPTWLADEHEPAPGETTIVLDPGQAFGSGHHATTAQCLELLDELDAEASLDGRAVADVGCGSGVLAIAAAMLGARAVGTDIDPDAVAVTRRNAAANGVEVATAAGSVAAALELLGDDAEVVLANLVTDTVAELAPELVAAIGDGGTLIVSGIAADRRRRATDPLREAGLHIEDERERDGWVALRGRRHRGDAPRSPDRRPGRAAAATEPVADHPDRDASAPPPPTCLAPARHTSSCRRRAVSARRHPTPRARVRRRARGRGARGCSLPATEAPAPATDPPRPRSAAPPPTRHGTNWSPRSSELRTTSPLPGTASPTRRRRLDPEARAAADAALELLVAPVGAERGRPRRRHPPAVPGRAVRSRAARGRRRPAHPHPHPARDVGGSFGNTVVDLLRDPVAGDLGAWQRDAAGVLASIDETIGTPPPSRSRRRRSPSCPASGRAPSPGRG